MKAIKIMLLGIVLSVSASMSAQVSVNVNIGTPPAWGPAGYASDIRYYYLPDIEVYYDIPTGMFIYFNNGGWVRTAYLPRRYRHYDLYSAYKVCLHDYGPNPYIYYKRHKVKYYKGYHGGPQVTLQPRPREVEYREVRNADRDYEYRDRRDERKYNDYRMDYRTAENNPGNGKGFERAEDRSNGRSFERNNNDHGNNRGYERGGDHGRGNEGNGRGGRR